VVCKVKRLKIEKRRRKEVTENNYL